MSRSKNKRSGGVRGSPPAKAAKLIDEENSRFLIPSDPQKFKTAIKNAFEIWPHILMSPENLTGHVNPKSLRDLLPWNAMYLRESLQILRQVNTLLDKVLNCESYDEYQSLVNGLSEEDQELVGEWIDCVYQNSRRKSEDGVPGFARSDADERQTWLQFKFYMTFHTNDLLEKRSMEFVSSDLFTISYLEEARCDLLRSRGDWSDELYIKILTLTQKAHIYMVRLSVTDLIC